MTKTISLEPKVRRLFAAVGVVLCLLSFERAALAVDPTTRLDFDGDGKTDFAVYRKGFLNRMCP